MNVYKAINKYVGPIIILLLLISFLMYMSFKEGFTDCACPSGSELKNGGCYSCPSGYKLSTDYYNSHCVSETPNCGSAIKPAIYKKISC